MKKVAIGSVLLLAVGSAVIGQVPNEQAQERLRARQHERLAASTQPATREEVDELWTELNRLKNEVQGLRDQMADYRRMLDFRDGKDPTKAKADPRAANGRATGRPAPAPVNNGDIP